MRPLSSQKFPSGLARFMAFWCRSFAQQMPMVVDVGLITCNAQAHGHVVAA